MEKAKSLLTKKSTWICVAALIVAIVIIAIVNNVTKPKIKKVELNKVTTEGWVALTPILDHGGAALAHNGREVILILGKSPIEGKVDYRLMDVSVEKTKDKEGELSLVISLTQNSERMGAKQLPDGSFAVSRIEEDYRPVAIYEIPTSSSNEKIIFNVNEEVESFNSIFEASDTKIIKQ